MDYHNIIEDEHNLKIDFKLPETHEFITSLETTRLGKLESISFNRIHRDELDFYQFIKHNFPEKVTCCEFWNCDFRYMTEDTLSELLHVLKSHIKSKISFQAFKSDFHFKTSQLKLILENANKGEFGSLNSILQFLKSFA